MNEKIRSKIDINEGRNAPYLGITIGSGVGQTDDDIESKLLVSLSFSVERVSRLADETYDESPDVDAPHVFGSARTLSTNVLAKDGTLSAFDSLVEAKSSAPLVADISKLASESVA